MKVAALVAVLATSLATGAVMVVDFSNGNAQVVVSAINALLVFHVDR